MIQSSSSRDELEKEVNDDDDEDEDILIETADNIIIEEDEEELVEELEEGSYSENPMGVGGYDDENDGFEFISRQGLIDYIVDLTQHDDNFEGMNYNIL